MKKVVILQRITGDYRIPFFERISDILQNNNISLKVLYGQPEPGEYNIGSFNNRSIVQIKNYYLKVKSKYLAFQFPLRYVFNSNLVILQQGNRIITNHFFIICLLILGKKVAIWGNCKQELTSYNNHTFKPGWWWKLSKKVDHWFAYNDLTKKIVESTGFPSEKITSVNNSIDTKSERAIYNSFTDEEIGILRVKYGLENSDIVGLFCSRLYADKRIDFLLHSIVKVKEEISNFKFFVVGDGHEYNKILEFSKMNHKWFFSVGAQYGRDKIKYFKLSNFQLMPGLVGLHIIDSFAFECPIITTVNTLHSVEIDYLKNGENGVISENSLEKYVNAIINVCKNKRLSEILKAGCIKSAQYYTIENMAQRFADGIIKTLENDLHKM